MGNLFTVANIYAILHIILQVHFPLLHLCKCFSDYQVQLDDMRTTNADMVRHAQYLEQEQLLMKVN